jgi:transposase
MKTYYIGADVHCNNTELAIEQNKQIVQRISVPTDIRSISRVLAEWDGQKHLTFEEGPMAGWLYRNLADKVHRLTVCDPRRNRLITCDGGDKNDRIDAGKLAVLLRGGFVRPVYHSFDEDRVELKRWVGLYHSRVRDATAQINRLRAQGRLYGIRIPAAALKDSVHRAAWLSSLKNEHLAGRLEVLWIGLDAVRRQVRQAHRRMVQSAKAYPMIRYWSKLPGVGPIRAITLFAYLDTPFRFKNKSKLWKYCGIGLMRQTSGQDNHGRERPGKLKLGWYCNKRLKDVVIGMAISAIRSKDNVFRGLYEQMIQDGKQPSNARHTVARKMVAVMWGMWKSDRVFCPQLL